MLNIGRGRRREHPQPFALLRGKITSISVANFRWKGRNLRLRMRTLQDRASSGRGHFRSGPLPVSPLPVTWLMSLPVTWLPVMRNGPIPIDPPQIRLCPSPYTTKRSLLVAMSWSANKGNTLILRNSKKKRFKNSHYFDCYIASMHSQTCLMWPSKGTVKYDHIRQVVP